MKQANLKENVMPKQCDICKRILTSTGNGYSRDCGGTCLQCMAKAGDVECLRQVHQLALESVMSTTKEIIEDLRLGLSFDKMLCKHGICLADEISGIYLPQEFLWRCAGWGLTKEDKRVLKEGPDGEDYEEVWADILDSASKTSAAGITWHLHQDAGLYAVPVSYKEPKPSLKPDVAQLVAITVTDFYKTAASLLSCYTVYAIDGDKSAEEYKEKIQDITLSMNVLNQEIEDNV